MDVKAVAISMGLDWERIEPIVANARAAGYSDEDILEGIVGITLEWINKYGSVEHVVKMSTKES